MSYGDYQINIHEPIDQSASFFASMELLSKTLYPWQRKAIRRALTEKKKKGREELIRFFSIQAPCGCGKTTLLIALSIYDIITSNLGQKQLIIVPQTHIGMGFTRENGIDYISIKLGKETYQWQVFKDQNFCSRNMNRAKSKALKKWLLTPASKLSGDCSDAIISGLNAVCCYQSLIMVWKKLTEDEKRQAICNLSLSVDEAHHLKHIYYIEGDFETEEEREAAHEEATEIGRICTYIMNSNIKSSKIRTASATMYRGDKKFIFSDTVKKMFVNYDYSWAAHFKTLGIKNFRFAYEEYKVTPVYQIAKNILKEKKERHLIIIPSMGNKWRESFKEELELLISLLVEGGMSREEILDLVTKRTQISNKELLLSEPKKLDSNNPSKFRVIIICKLGREGTDWCPCTRIHNGSNESTLTLAMQTIGRLLRRYAGKQNIITTTYIKEFVAPKNITSRELLSDRTNALLLCMQLNDSFRPILISIIPSGEKKNSKKRIKVDLGEYLGDRYQGIKEEMISRYEGIDDKSSKSIREMLSKLLEENNVTENIEIVTNGLLAVITRIAVRSDKVSPPEFIGINASFARKGGFDILKAKKKIKKTIYFGDCSKKDFDEIKRVIKKYLGMYEYDSLENVQEWVEKKGFANMAEYLAWVAKQPIIEATKNREKVK